MTPFKSKIRPAEKLAVASERSRLNLLRGPHLLDERVDAGSHLLAALCRGCRFGRRRVLRSTTGNGRRLAQQRDGNHQVSDACSIELHDWQTRSRNGAIRTYRSRAWEKNTIDLATSIVAILAGRCSKLLNTNNIGDGSGPASLCVDG